MHHLLRGARLAHRSAGRTTRLAGRSAPSAGAVWSRCNSSASGSGKKDAADAATAQPTPAPAPPSAKDAVPPTTPQSKPAPRSSTPPKAKSGVAPTAAAAEATAKDLARPKKVEQAKDLEVPVTKGDATVVQEKSHPSPKVVEPEAVKLKVETPSPAKPAAATPAPPLPTTTVEGSQTEQVKAKKVDSSATLSGAEAKSLLENDESVLEDDEYLPSEIKAAMSEMEKLGAEHQEEGGAAAQQMEAEMSDEEVEEMLKLIEKQGLANGNQPKTPEFHGSLTPLPTLESLGSSYTEPEYAAALAHGRSVQKPYYHPKTHHIPVASIHFASHSPYQLTLFTHFASHAAAALGVPISGVVALPKRRRLWTVIKGPFVHKKSQENFERVTHRRAIKMWDADSEVVDLLVGYLRKHMLGGVGMRVTRWERREVGMGAAMGKAGAGAKGQRAADKVKEMGERIVKTEGAPPAEIQA